MVGSSRSRRRLAGVCLNSVVHCRCLCLGSCLSLRPCRMLLPWMVDAFLRPKPCWCRRSVRRALPCRPTRLCIFGGFWSDALHHIAMSLPPLRKRCCRSSSDRLRSGAQPAPPVVPLQPAALPVPDQPLPAPERDPSPALVAPPAPRPLASSQPARLPPLGFPEEDVGFGTPVPVAQPPAGPPPLRFPEDPAPPLTPRVALMEVRVSRPTRTQPLQRACHACRT